jgi:hypothetical protein
MSSELLAFLISPRRAVPAREELPEEGDFLEPRDMNVMGEGALIGDWDVEPREGGRKLSASTGDCTLDGALDALSPLSLLEKVIGPRSFLKVDLILCPLGVRLPEGSVSMKGKERTTLQHNVTIKFTQGAVGVTMRVIIMTSTR